MRCIFIVFSPKMCFAKLIRHDCCSDPWDRNMDMFRAQASKKKEHNSWFIVFFPLCGVQSTSSYNWIWMWMKRLITVPLYWIRVENVIFCTCSIHRYKICALLLRLLFLVSQKSTQISYKICDCATRFHEKRHRVKSALHANIYTQNP